MQVGKVAEKMIIQLSRNDCSKTHSTQGETKKTSEFPKWVHDLFLRFSLIYGGIWSYGLRSDAEVMAKKTEWYLSLQRYSAPVVANAIERVKLQFDQPPSIKQFYDLCQVEEDRLKPEKVLVEEKKPYRNWRDCSDEVRAAVNEMRRKLGLKIISF